MIEERMAGNGKETMTSLLLNFAQKPSIGIENGWHFRWNMRNKAKAMTALGVNLGGTVLSHIGGIAAALMYGWGILKEMEVAGIEPASCMVAYIGLQAYEQGNLEKQVVCSHYTASQSRLNTTATADM